MRGENGGNNSGAVAYRADVGRKWCGSVVVRFDRVGGIHSFNCFGYDQRRTDAPVVNPSPHYRPTTFSSTHLSPISLYVHTTMYTTTLARACV